MNIEVVYMDHKFSVLYCLELSYGPESQEKDEDIFSSKRLKLRLRIAKTLFPETDEVPIELSA